MSDFLVIRGLEGTQAKSVLDGWAAPRPWVRSAIIKDGWETQELEINSRNAQVLMRGKHKRDLAELIASIGEHGGQVIHVMLHRSTVERSEADLKEWAVRIQKR